MEKLFTLERRTGRVVEARIIKLANDEHADRYMRAFTPPLLRGRPILLADHRPVVIYTQSVAAKLIELFTSLNVHWERVAIVIAPTNATLTMQLSRVVRESANPSRRVFTDAAEACRFLAETLTGAEVSRARDFLDEFQDPPRSSRR